MSFELDCVKCKNHAGSREQSGEPAQQAGVPHEESTVCRQPGDPAGECEPSRRISVLFNLMYLLLLDLLY